MVRHKDPPATQATPLASDSFIETWMILYVEPLGDPNRPSRKQVL